MDETADLDEFAATVLAAENVWTTDEWQAVEVLARSLIDEAHFFGVDCREHAANRLASLRTSLTDDPPLTAEADFIRGDLAMAAALIYVGRIVA